MSFSRTSRHPHLVVPGSGLANELYWLRQEVADALSSGGGGGGFIFDSTGLQQQDPTNGVYTDWADLCAAIAALPNGAAPEITFIGSFTIPLAGMPPTGWYMCLGTWKAAILATGAIVVDIPDGVLIDSLGFLQTGIAVKVQPTTVDGVFNWNTLSSFAPGVPWIFGIGLGACLNNAGTKAAILGPGTGQFIALATQSATFGVIGPDTAPFVKADAPDVVISAQSFSGFYGSLPPNWLEGSANLFEQVGADTRDVQNAGWTGSVSAQAISKINPRAQTSAHKRLIFTDVPPPSPPTLPEPDTFNDWSLLMATYAQMPGPVDIVFRQSSPGSPLHLPAGTWTMNRATWWRADSNVGGECQVYLDDGCVIHDLGFIGDGVAVVGNSTSPSLTFTPPTPGGPPAILLLAGIGCALANAGTSPMIAWTEDVSNGALILGMQNTAIVSKDGGGAPILDVTPGGAYTSVAGFFMYGGTVSDNVISGSNGAGQAGCIKVFRSDTAQFSCVQPSWAGLPLGIKDTYQVNQRPRFNIQTDPLTAVGPYVMGDAPTSDPGTTLGDNGSEFVRVAPTANVVGVQLPDPRNVPGQTVPIKEVSGAPAFNTELTTPSGNIEGAAGPYSILPTPYFAVRLTSDGTDWWIT